MITTPCIVGDNIQELPALSAEFLSRPAAFFNEIPASELWNLFLTGKIVAEIVKENESRYGGKNILNVIKWLFNHSILSITEEIQK